jgi:bifunctional non-homologous end joining protein LigD
MKDRPQSLNRFPNGINGESFYQKNMKGKVDPWLKTFERFSDSDGEAKDFLVCTGEASLLYMASLGCIEMNPWHSRVSSPQMPDWCVIDLDPGEISFSKVIETALVVRKVLDSLQIPSYPKTSGSTGIHIYIPLGAKYNYLQSRQLAELIANLVHNELPSFTSLLRNPGKRRDKIYIDFLQNREIQTICAPYSVRPKKGATVSAPLDWSEVKPGLKISQFTMKTIKDRVKREGDLFDGVLSERIDLNAVLQQLAALI